MYLSFGMLCALLVCLYAATCCNPVAAAETVRHAQAAERAHLSVHRGLRQTHRHGVPRAHDHTGVMYRMYRSGCQD